MTDILENDYKFSVLTGKSGQIAFTNGTTRDMKFRELVVAKDANDNAFIGFVANVDGISASETGLIDLYEGQEIATDQFTAGSFVAGDSNVYVLTQTNSSQALIKQATATGLFKLKALIISYSASGTLRLRMPTQDGNIVAEA